MASILGFKHAKPPVIIRGRGHRPLVLWECNGSYPSKFPLPWRHNDHDGVSNHQPHGCLLNRLFRRRSKKTSKLRVTGLCVGNSPGPVNSPHKGPVTRKMFLFDDVIMQEILFKGNKQAPDSNVSVDGKDICQSMTALGIYVDENLTFDIYIYIYIYR